MKFLLTGVAGFLGSHLAEVLLSNNQEVIGVDNYYTGSKKNVEHLLQDSNFELIRHDITIPLFIEADFILNLACPASPIQYQKHPVQTLKTSVLGITNMLGIAKRLGIPIFQASTSEVYGDPAFSPQHEEYWGNVNPIGIRSCYDEGKRVAETLMFDYHRQYGVEIKIARIFNTYGPRMHIDDGRVVSNFIVSALRGDPLTIYGNGEQTRSFCYVDDLIQGINKFIASDIPNLSPMNLGSSQEMTVLELAESIIALTNSTSKIVNLPLPQDDPQMRKPDITKATKSLSWEPKIALEVGLMRTINYFDSIL